VGDNADASWHNAPVTVALTGVDAESGVTLPSGLEYKVDGGSFTAGTSVVVPAPANGSNDGTHTITMSPDRRFYLDEFSDRDTPPSLTLHDADGTLRAVLAAPRTELVASFRFEKPEIFTVPAADGFALPARILKPRGFDPARRDVEAALVEIALDDLAVDLALRERARAVRAEVVHRVVFTVDVEHGEHQAAGLDLERAAGRDIRGAAQINPLGHERPRNLLCGLLCNLLGWRSLTVRTRDVIKVGTLFRIEERPPRRKTSLST